MWSPISSISFSWFFHISFTIRLKNQFISSIVFLAVAELLLLLIFIQFFCRLDNCSIIELHIWWLFDFSFAKLTIFSEVFLSVILILILPVGVCLLGSCWLQFDIDRVLWYHLQEVLCCILWSFCWFCWRGNYLSNSVL